VLRERGLLMAADRKLPSVVTLVAGQPIRGSWWAHPSSHEIFGATSALASHPDAIALPLVSGKVTFVHRRLWPALLSVALAGEAWQTQSLTAPARALMARLEKTTELQASGDPVREIERRLLARSAHLHTELGAHAKRLERWDRWAQRVDAAPLSGVAEAKRVIEEAAAALASGSGVSPRLPWMSS
jgi:hypothetical protein